MAVRTCEDRRTGSPVFVTVGAGVEVTGFCVDEDCVSVEEGDDTDDSPFDDGTTGVSGAEGVLPIGVSLGRGSTLSVAGR